MEIDETLMLMSSVNDDVEYAVGTKECSREW